MQKRYSCGGAAPGIVTFKANNPDICDVEEAYADRSCKLIPKKAGEATVTVHATATDHYLEGSVDVKIIVKGDSSTEQKITLQYESGSNGSLRAVNAATGRKFIKWSADSSEYRSSIYGISERRLFCEKLDD